MKTNINQQINFNKFLNSFEIKKGLTQLSSYPRYVGIGTHFFCNAKCIFCLGGNYECFTVERYKRFFEEKLKNILCKAEVVDFHGYGELLLMPNINRFIKYINKTLSEQIKTIFTNGIALKNINFSDGKYNVMVSLHASNKSLHKQIVGVDSFDYIVSNIVNLKKYKNVDVTLYSVLNKLNINDMENFVKLAAKLKVKNVIFKYMTIFNYNHFNLSVFMDRNNANDNILKALKTAKKLGININCPPLFFEKNKISPVCMQPWNNIYIENQGTVNPCCFSGGHIGNLEKMEFSSLWNSKKYQNLRDSIINNKPNEYCKKCINYNLNNINKLSSHITFRKSTHNKLLRFITDNKNVFSLSINDII